MIAERSPPTVTAEARPRLGFFLRAVRRSPIAYDSGGVKRPLPLIPRGPRRRRKRADGRRLIFGCPRVSPEWELGMLHVLMKPKPQTRAHVEHRAGEQPWGPADERQLTDVLEVLNDRLHADFVVHRPERGEYHFLVEYTPAQSPEVLALAIALSRRLPAQWFVLDRLFVHAGVVHRRQFGYKLNLVPASNVHLPRPIRAALRGVF